MSDLLPASAINPSSLAAKLAAVANREAPGFAAELDQCPRLVEALWWIQWKSIQPGGLPALVEELVRSSPERFVTKAMQDIGSPRGGLYSFHDMLAVWDSIPRGAWAREHGPHREREDLMKLMANGRDMNFQALKREGVDLELAHFFTPEFFQSICIKEAILSLAGCLRDLCEKNEFTFANGNPVARWDFTREPDLWYIPDLPSALFAVMDGHAEHTKSRIASTEVVKIIWREMDFAIFARGLVTINGDTRFGKTEAIRTWTDAYPGRMRYFAVPPNGRLSDMHRALAVSFGLPYGSKTNEAVIKDQINFILQFGRIGIAADESHFLLPTRNAEPRRLDWLRTQIVDKGTPCVLSLTPQFTAALSRFSSYNAAQWLGRTKRSVILRDSLTEDDLVAVARKHLPGFTRAFLKRVAGQALRSHHLLAALQNVAERARWIAQEAGRAQWIAADVSQAMEDCLPQAAGASLPPPGMEADPTPAASSRTTRPTLASRPLTAAFLPPSRAVTPAIEASLAATD